MTDDNEKLINPYSGPLRDSRDEFPDEAEAASPIPGEFSERLRPPKEDELTRFQDNIVKRYGETLKDYKFPGFMANIEPLTPELISKLRNAAGLLEKEALEGSWDHVPTTVSIFPSQVSQSVTFESVEAIRDELNTKFPGMQTIRAMVNALHEAYAALDHKAPEECVYHEFTEGIVTVKMNGPGLCLKCNAIISISDALRKFYRHPYLGI